MNLRDKSIKRKERSCSCGGMCLKSFFPLVCSAFHHPRSARSLLVRYRSLFRFTPTIFPHFFPSLFLFSSDIRDWFCLFSLRLAMLSRFLLSFFSPLLFVQLLHFRLFSLVATIFAVCTLSLNFYLLCRFMNFRFFFFFWFFFLGT